VGSPILPGSHFLSSEKVLKNWSRESKAVRVVAR